MAQLAIKGHVTRGKEVIEILEMLGGKNIYNLTGTKEIWYILSGSTIEHSVYLFEEKRFTLEEFLEKFPYKVGDKVQHKGATSCGSVFEVEKMRWEEDTVKYTLRLWGCNYKSSTLPAEYLQPYKEAPIYLNEKANKQAEEIKEILEPVKKIMEKEKKYYDEWLQTDYLEFENNDDTWADEVEVNLGKDYEIQIRGNKTFIVKKKRQYPNTYEMCCDILDTEPYGRSAGYKSDLVTAFRNLLICRDAYWKIAGEQMGLGEPWKPDFLNPTKEIRYFIFCTGISIEKGQGLFPTNKILIFPTEEMRDAFYENFKELIELCKELL